MIHYRGNFLQFIVQILIIALISNSCKAQSKTKSVKDKKIDLSKYSKAYFASGCFWCVEAVFESVDGVVEAISGYSGGNEINPTYEQVSNGNTGHAETVEVYYDSTIVNYSTLLEIFFDSHDPSTLNKQGPDAGYQYRSAIFYTNLVEKKLAENYIIKLLNERVFSKITTQIEPFMTFYPAENYHQDYEKNNPTNFYVQRVSLPRLNKFKAKTKVKLK
jgi:peptide-methionine (S)-S-oxide reductase